MCGRNRLQRSHLSQTQTQDILSDDAAQRRLASLAFSKLLLQGVDLYLEHDPFILMLLMNLLPDLPFYLPPGRW